MSPVLFVGNHQLYGFRRAKQYTLGTVHAELEEAIVPPASAPKVRPLGNAPARRLRLLRARLAALGSSALSG